MNRNKKYKLQKTKKILITLGLSAAMIPAAVTGAIVHEYSTVPASDNKTSAVSTNNSKEKNVSTGVSAYNYIDDGYLSVNFSNEKKAFVQEKKLTPISIDNNLGQNFNIDLEKNLDDFGKEKYYDLNNTLNYFNKMKQDKLTSYGIIKNNALDVDRLYNIIIKNNKNYMSQSSTKINYFYSEASESEIRNICILIKYVYSKSENLNDEKLDNILGHLKVFRNQTTSSNAYVTDLLELAFNPQMINLFSEMQGLKNNVKENENIDDAVFCHEIEHIFQYASNDLNKDNGIEAGFCRKSDNVNVNSLWYSWLLEGSAEYKMTEVLNTTPKTYDKKISYINSYELSRIFDDSYIMGTLVDCAFESDLNTVFDKLNIKDNEAKMEFLKLMYTIEITQSDTKDFWKFYEESENIKLTDEEHKFERIMMREDAIRYLTKKFYIGLSNAILNNKIQDAQTLFYFMRLWELDCYGHLCYNDAEQYKYSSNFVLWLDDIEKELIKYVSQGSNISYNKLLDEYENYHMKISDNTLEMPNADFSRINVQKQAFINKVFDKYSVTFFSKISDVADYNANNYMKK